MFLTSPRDRILQRRAFGRRRVLRPPPQSHLAGDRSWGGGLSWPAGSDLGLEAQLGMFTDADGHDVASVERGARGHAGDPRAGRRGVPARAGAAGSAGGELRGGAGAVERRACGGRRTSCRASRGPTWCSWGTRTRRTGGRCSVLGAAGELWTVVLEPDARRATSSGCRWSGVWGARCRVGKEASRVGRSGRRICEAEASAQVPAASQPLLASSPRLSVERAPPSNGVSPAPLLAPGTRLSHLFRSWWTGPVGSGDAADPT